MLPPIILQMAVGADVLWHQRRLVFASLLPAVAYFSVTDALAIRSGTWTIDPAQSTGVMLGALPLEELIFFTLTNMLIVFGMTLVLSHRTVLAQLLPRGRRVGAIHPSLTDRVRDESPLRDTSP
jgi:putative membrane protein